MKTMLLEADRIMVQSKNTLCPYLALGKVNNFLNDEYIKLNNTRLSTTKILNHIFPNDDINSTRLWILIEQGYTFKEIADYYG